MVVSERGAQASCAKKPGQAALRGAALVAAAGWLLAGCSSSINPVNWWHRQQGGKIAEERPPPPGADQPYPNIASVPPKPEVPNAEALKQLTDSLVADRTNAQHAAQAAPLADPSSPAASPSLFGVGTAPPPPPSSATPPSASARPGTPVASASMPAVNAPPAPPTPPAAAPRRPVQSTPLDAPRDQTPVQSTAAPAAASASPSDAAALPSSVVQPRAAAPVPAVATPPASSAAQPELPAGPPARPFAASRPPAPTVMPEPMPPPSSGQSATIVFVPGAATLSQPATEEVKAFAAKRGNLTVGVTGYGDATSSDPDAQSAALTLGLSRAQSILEALKAAGVPGTAVRVSAEASGRGASLHLLQ
jgi:outer membrane protein OmpA-like peptidoglycan-associated protein